MRMYEKKRPGNSVSLGAFLIRAGLSIDLDLSGQDLFIVRIIAFQKLRCIEAIRTLLLALSAVDAVLDLAQEMMRKIEDCIHCGQWMQSSILRIISCALGVRLFAEGARRSISDMRAQLLI